MLLRELEKRERHNRKATQIRALLASGYPISNAAMDFAEKFHTGMRKDGQTPEFYHQISIVRVIKKFEANLIHPDETIATGFLHDVGEDYGIEFSYLGDNFGHLVGHATDLLSKKTPTNPNRDIDALFAGMAECPISSVVKPVDRVHNQSTMGIFGQSKKNSYMDFTDQKIIPMILAARDNFPQQKPVYDTLLRILGYQKTMHYKQANERETHTFV